jgi:hypothetical protein
MKFGWLFDKFIIFRLVIAKLNKLHITQITDKFGALGILEDVQNYWIEQTALKY